MPAPAPPAPPAPLRTSSSADSDWRLRAACTGLAPQTVFARRPKAALPALRACAVCSVRRPCLDTVAPADNLFDGVSGGSLWRNGRRVAVPEALAAALEPQEQP
ncbi:WhiB family transcriptional regulator [Streptomyces luteireticuli]|uniref:4Fe-4S Wbl-type domain-containing protein n=1 Tax=Streptomyces luteireticuli TaxID=173858 RepID=A0ABN0Z2H0_9ACTN